MRTLITIFCVFATALGALLLSIAAILLNQEVHLVRMSWGIFYIQSGDVTISNEAATIIIGSVGFVFLLVGIVPIFRRFKTAA